MRGGSVNKEATQDAVAPEVGSVELGGDDRWPRRFARGCGGGGRR